MYYDRIDMSQGIDLAKSRKSKECMISHHLFFNHWFKFQDSICKGSHDFAMLSINIRNIAIITVKNVHYCCIINNISKPEAVDLLKILFLRIVGIYKKDIVLIFSQFYFYFFYFFCLVNMKWLIGWKTINHSILILEQ